MPKKEDVSSTLKVDTTEYERLINYVSEALNSGLAKLGEDDRRNYERMRESIKKNVEDFFNRYVPANSPRRVTVETIRDEEDVKKGIMRTLIKFPIDRISITIPVLSKDLEQLKRDHPEWFENSEAVLHD